MPVSDYTPDVEAVAAFLRARTKTHGGSEAGTFTVDTRPTATQVDVEVQNALGDISGVVGADIPTQYFEPVKRVAALRTALLIELTYFPEQVASNRSPYKELKDLYDEAWNNLLDVMGLGEPGEVTDPYGGYPSGGGFPLTAIGMENPW